jgi:hypothetical protein
VAEVEAINVAVVVMATKVGVEATMVVATIIGNIKVTMLATMVHPIKFVPSLDIPPTNASEVQ